MLGRMALGLLGLTALGLAGRAALGLLGFWQEWRGPVYMLYCYIHGTCSLPGDTSWRHTGEIFRQAEALRTVYFEGFLDLSKFAYVSEATINK